MTFGVVEERYPSAYARSALQIAEEQPVTLATYFEIERRKTSLYLRLEELKVPLVSANKAGRIHDAKELSSPLTQIIPVTQRQRTLRNNQRQKRLLDLMRNQ